MRCDNDKGTITESLFISVMIVVIIQWRDISIDSEMNILNCAYEIIYIGK